MPAAIPVAEGEHSGGIGMLPVSRPQQWMRPNQLILWRDSPRAHVTHIQSLPHIIDMLPMARPCDAGAGAPGWLNTHTEPGPAI